MDSGGNSGSMQSSSTGGGDEAEYDSSSHAFFHVGGTGGGGVSGSGGGGGGNSMQPPSLQQQQQSSLFDSLSNFLTNDNHNTNNPSSSSLVNLDILLQNPSSAIPRSQLNSFNYSLMASSSSSPSPHLGRVDSHNPSLPTNSTTDHHQENNNNNIQPNRNSKKRSRASRRAPTTVLTTDTSNFRAIVQEFTGIPTQPFTSSPSLLFPRSNRLDLFSNTSTTSRSCGGDSLLLLRPFAQKPIQVPPFLSSSTSSMLLNLNTSTANPNINQSQNNNPSLIPYQSLLLQPNSSRNENNDAKTNTGSGGGGGVGLPNLVTSDGLIRNASSSWEDQDHLLRSLSGNYSNRSYQHQQQRVIMNADKGSTASNNNQNVSTATRGEGMVDSWICSSSE